MPIVARNSKAGCECVVPVVSGWWQTLDRRVEKDHPPTGRFSRSVNVESAVDVVAASYEWNEPWWTGPNSGGRDADAGGVKFHAMYLEATDRIDGRFAKDDFFRTCSADPEVAQVPARAGRQSVPRSLTSAA